MKPIKLKGSLTELKLREHFIAQNYHLNNNGNPRLSNALKSYNVNLKNAHIFSWTPGQGEDIYTIIADKKNVIIVELSRVDESFQIEFEPIDLYFKDFRQQDLIKASVIFDILSNSRASPAKNKI